MGLGKAPLALNSTSAGHRPPGDSPGGTGSAPGANEDAPPRREHLTLPVGGSPTGTGGSPVLPILRRSSEALACANINVSFYHSTHSTTNHHIKPCQISHCEKFE